MGEVGDHLPLTFIFRAEGGKVFGAFGFPWMCQATKLRQAKLDAFNDSLKDQLTDRRALIALDVQFIGTA